MGDTAVVEEYAGTVASSDPAVDVASAQWTSIVSVSLRMSEVESMMRRSIVVHCFGGLIDDGWQAKV